MTDLDRMAPPGTIWVCGACGKTAEDRYGIEGEKSRGWDESCMMNAVLCMKDSLEYDGGRVIKADASPDYEEQVRQDPLPDLDSILSEEPDPELLELAGQALERMKKNDGKQ